MEPTINVPISRFIHYVLGGGYWEKREIHPDDAFVINELIKNREVEYCHIQFKDEWDSHLEEPILWNYSLWKQSSELYERQKRWSEENRKRSFIFEANVKLISKHLQKEFFMSETVGTMTALTLLQQKKFGNIKALGIVKLIDRIEDV